MNNGPTEALPSRRDAMIAGAGLTIGSLIAGTSSAAQAGRSSPENTSGGAAGESFVTRDGVRIFFKDWGPRDGTPIVFSHGWPLSADAWDDQMLFLGEQGYRCVAHDRRGHGRSEQTWLGNDMDHYADDLADLVAHLGLKKAVHVGHSTGGGEVVRYVARHGTANVGKVVLIGAVPPLMLQTKANPGGLPMEFFDGLRAAFRADRAQLYRNVASGPFYGFNRPGAVVSQGLIDTFWLIGMQSGVKASFDCIKAFSETDFTQDLVGIDVPTLIIHGDDDQVVPIAASAQLAAKLVKGSILKVYAGGSHGICATEKDRVNADLLAFVKG